MLTVDTIPLRQKYEGGRMKDEQRQPSVLKDRMILSSFILPPSTLLCFLVISVFAATAAELAKLKPVRRGLLILGRYVVSALACTTLKNNIIAWHNFNS